MTTDEPREWCPKCQADAYLEPTENQDGKPMWACAACGRWIRRMTADEAREYAGG